MVDMKRARLERKEKKVTLNDERQVRKMADEAIRQTKKDLFNPARLTVRTMDRHEQEIDRQLANLERVMENVRSGHSQYADIKSKKAELNSWKKRLRMARKAKKLGEKNERVSRALQEGYKKHTNGPIKSLLARHRRNRATSNS